MSQGIPPVERRLYKNVTRVDFPEQHRVGYNVRVGWKGEMVRRFFADKKHGGRERALLAAVAYRDDCELSISKPRTERFVYYKVGAGVKRVVKNGVSSLGVHWCPLPGKVARTSVSIKKYGEAEAMRRATAIREAKQSAVLSDASCALPQN